MTARGNARGTARRTARRNACVSFLTHQREQLFTRIGMYVLDLDPSTVGAAAELEA